MHSFINETAVMIVDRENGCFIKLDLRIMGVTGQGYIGVCDEKELGPYTSFKLTRFKKPRSTGYSSNKNLFHIIDDSKAMVVCEFDISECTDVTGLFPPIRDYSALVLFDSVVIYIESSCQYYLYINNAYRHLSLLSTSYSCGQDFWVKTGNHLLTLSQHDCKLVFAHANYSDEENIKHWAYSVRLLSDCSVTTQYPTEQVTFGVVQQNGNDDFFYSTSSSYGTKIYHMGDAYSITCKRASSLLRVTQFPYSSCGKNVLRSIKFVDVEACAYNCVKNKYCSSFAFNKHSGVCRILSCFNAWHKPYIQLDVDSDCYVFESCGI